MKKTIFEILNNAQDIRLGTQRETVYIKISLYVKNGVYYDLSSLCQSKFDDSLVLFT